ncbi:MAG: GNAT family N-acetyltransferase [Pseudomonadota bacterium]
MAALFCRPATVHDAPAIAALLVRAWREAYAAILPAEVLAAQRVDAREPRIRALLEGSEPDHTMHVAERDGRIVGFVGFGAARENPIRPAPAGVGEVFGIYLDPDAFGSGAGATLLALAEGQLAARFQRAVLWTFEDNARARRFYERQGWRHDGAVAPYPRPGCTGVRVVRYQRVLCVGCQALGHQIL